MTLMLIFITCGGPSIDLNSITTTNNNIGTDQQYEVQPTTPTNPSYAVGVPPGPDKTHKSESRYDPIMGGIQLF